MIQEKEKEKEIVEIGKPTKPKGSRKRTQSGSHCVNHNNNNHHHHNNNKRQKRNYSHAYVPPTKFLLGGNIHDPLNLKGLGNDASNDEEISDMDTLKLLIGGTTEDPLNLKGIEERTRIREQARDQALAGSSKGEGKPSSENLSLELSENISENFFSRKLDRKDKIVSPVIPQPYKPLKNVHYRHPIITPNVSKDERVPKFKKKNENYRYGNCIGGTEYKILKPPLDPRVKILGHHRSFVRNKDILDVGCNIGHVALSIGKHYEPRSVTGVDIDRKLIEIARNNVQYLLFRKTSPRSKSNSPTDSVLPDESPKLKLKWVPIAVPFMSKCVNQTDPKSSSEGKQKFPKNITFIHANYLIKSVEPALMDKPQYDTILCLNVTKWVHLNWGDKALKSMFKKMYTQLRPGGRLILEAQAWGGYKKKKGLTEIIWKNYHEIEFFPHHFEGYLLSEEIGFLKCHTIGYVTHRISKRKSFRRPVQVFYKGLNNKKDFESPTSTQSSPAVSASPLSTHTLSIHTPASVISSPAVPVSPLSLHTSSIHTPASAISSPVVPASPLSIHTSSIHTPASAVSSSPVPSSVTSPSSIQSITTPSSLLPSSPLISPSLSPN